MNITPRVRWRAGVHGETYLEIQTNLLPLYVLSAVFTADKLRFDVALFS